MHEDGGRHGRGQYTLADTEHGTVWGTCTAVDGLFEEPWHETYELVDWEPQGAEVRGWISRRVWLVPEDEALGPWLLEDVESLGRHSGSLVLTGSDDYEGPPESYDGLVRAHDEQRWLGSCRAVVRVLPPERTVPRLVLRELTPSNELRAVLAKGTRRALNLEEVALKIRDRQGAPLTERLLWASVGGWRRSRDGRDVIDLELEGTLFAPVPDHARPVWERWLAGAPGTEGAWADLDTRRRGVWLALVRERSGRRARADRPAGHAYVLDGRHATDEPGLYLALGEAVNGPGGYFGGGLDALDDCLRGRFGYTAPATLLWRDAATAREHLSDRLTPEGRPFDLFAEVLDVLARGGMNVTLA
ncbi:barstar family protein [Actinomadura fibrosa]|uniref:Barstar family protein n=1 Tax=Actinomadura fibrosa TaxID=111802 RepID=A0ABW2XNG8_9ACTN|nr:barstar family protein [Actinomadura fibrosa]